MPEDNPTPALPPAPPPAPISNMTWERIGPFVKLAAILIFSGLVLYFVWKATSGDFKLLNTLKDTEAARGLITFLIAGATVAIAVILALGTIFGDKETYKERFDSGKEVLTILIGVLGTIVGFYYGSTTTNTTVEQLQLATPVLSKQELREGETLNISTSVIGGSEPYTYQISSDHSDVIPTTTGGKVPEDGKLSLSFNIPKVTADADVIFNITVTDSEDKTASSSGKFVIKAQTAATPTPTPPT